ncbi:MAG: glycosyltransferase family 39 protein [Parvularculaceae bacterium]|nr:glycosyltransferase family 39 protein [Parvularculaceae bacterium]
MMMSHLFSTPGRQFAVFASVLTALRIVMLIFGAPELGPDEGQYWFWSLTPDFGYFSKPPLIAWSIFVTTSIFGHAEWAVRLSAPLFHAGAASFLFLTARLISDARAGFWAGVAWLTIPGVFLSSALITTDAPLLFFWSMALYYFLVLVLDRTSTPRAAGAALGAAIGLGLLAKYAMIYFIPGAALALFIAPALRRNFAALMLAGAVAALLIASNIWWNAQHDFQTLSHTAANANWGGDLLHPGALAGFLGDQFGVVGPILLVLMIFALATPMALASHRNSASLALIAFALPPLLIVSTQAFISRAHGNWAAVAYPSAVVLTAVWATRVSRPRAMTALKASVVLHLLVGAGFMASYVSPAFADAVGAASAYKRLRGWRIHATDILRNTENVDAIMTDDREIMGEIVYYARGGPRIVAFDSNHRIDHHFEAFNAFNPERDRRVLYITADPNAAAVRERFAEVNMLHASVAEIQPGKTRTLYIFRLEGLRG